MSRDSNQVAAVARGDLARYHARWGIVQSANTSGQYWHALDTAARSVNVDFRKILVQNVPELELAIADLARQPGNSLAVMPNVFVFNNRERIVSLAAQHRPPAIYPCRDWRADCLRYRQSRHVYAHSRLCRSHPARCGPAESIHLKFGCHANFLFVPRRCCFSGYTADDARRDDCRIRLR